MSFARQLHTTGDAISAQNAPRSVPAEQLHRLVARRGFQGPACLRGEPRRFFGSYADPAQIVMVQTSSTVVAVAAVDVDAEISRDHRT